MIGKRISSLILSEHTSTWSKRERGSTNSVIVELLFSREHEL